MSLARSTELLLQLVLTLLLRAAAGAHLEPYPLGDGPARQLFKVLGAEEPLVEQDLQQLIAQLRCAKLCMLVSRWPRLRDHLNDSNLQRQSPAAAAMA